MKEMLEIMVPRLLDMLFTEQNMDDAKVAAVEWLRAKAESTETVIDDAFVDKMAEFLDVEA